MSHNKNSKCLTIAQLNNSLVSSNCNNGTNLGWNPQNTVIHSVPMNTYPASSDVGFRVNERKIDRLSENIAFLDQKRLENEKVHAEFNDVVIKKMPKSLDHRSIDP